MRITKGNKLEFIPASHEDPTKPGVLKKVLFGKEDLIRGKIMMINWSKMEVGKAFAPHYHEDMEEVFIIISGKAKIRIDQEEAELEAEDAVITPMGKIHEMKNIGDQDVYYLALGISLEKNGKSINVSDSFYSN